MIHEASQWVTAVRAAQMNRCGRWAKTVLTVLV